MRTHASRKSRASAGRRPTGAARLAEQAALRRAVRVEQRIRRLATQLDRECQRTNDRLQTLAMILSARARAIELERDVERSLAREETPA